MDRLFKKDDRVVVSSLSGNVVRGHVYRDQLEHETTVRVVKDNTKTSIRFQADMVKLES